MNIFMVDHKLILVISLYKNKKQIKVSVCVWGGGGDGGILFRI